MLFDPLNLNYLLVGVAALTSAGYFVRVRDKTASTWFMLAFLAAWAVPALILAFWSFTHDSITADATFYTSLFGIGTIVLIALAGPMLVQAAYRFMGNPFPREANSILALSIAAALIVIPWLRNDPEISVGTAHWMTTFWSLWGAGVLLRKWRLVGDNSSRVKAGCLAIAGFFLVVGVSETFAGFNLIWGSSPSIGMHVLTLILQYAAVLAFPVVYVQYAPEPTTFQVKLVGFVLLIALSAFGVLNAQQSAIDDQRQAFDPAPGPRTLTFTPVGTRFEIIETDLSFEDDIGENLLLQDDSKAIVQLPFGFPFAGDTLRTVVVDANGAIEPASGAYPFESFSVAIATVNDRPLIAPWYNDMNPGAGGSVHARTHSDRLVVTWKDVPEWSYFLPHTLQAVLYESGRIDFNYADLPFDTNVGASGVLTDPAARAASVTSPMQNLDGLIDVGPVKNPLAVYDRRHEFKEYLHAETMPFVWVVFGTFAFILVVAPLFFRFVLTRPLNQLLTGMRKVNDGDLAAELPLGVKDELGNLATNFNQMTGSLRAYSGEMEALVADRTSELNQSLQSLKATQEQLVHQEKMASLGQLTAGIAHEIKNPLNFVNNFADINSELADELLEAIESGEDPTEIVTSLKENAKVIAAHGRRADGIVRSMMDHAGHGASDKEPVEVNAFVGESVNLAYHGRLPATEGPAITLEKSYADDAGSVPMIRQDMARVLINLLGNAFDAVSSVPATEGYKPVVRVSTRRETGLTDRVVIEISDNGPGVPPDLKQKIFEPFYTTKPSGQGTGLGLSMSYEIVTAGHGGTMTLEDAVEGGARFVLILPA